MPQQPENEDGRKPAARNVSVTSLIASLAMSVGIASLASALVLGLIPGSRHAAERYACAPDSACASAYLVLAVPGLALALLTIAGATTWAIIRVRRHRRTQGS